jgi:hypothetical protein
MKAVVVKTFRDKNTNRMFRPGRTIEITEERFEEINSTALGIFVAAVGEQKPKKTKGGKKNAQ